MTKGHENSFKWDFFYILHTSAFLELFVYRDSINLLYLYTNYLNIHIKHKNNLISFFYPFFLSMK